MCFGFMAIGAQRAPMAGLSIEGGDLIVTAELHGPLELPAPVTITGDDGVAIGPALMPAFTDNLTGEPVRILGLDDILAARIRVSFAKITVAGAA